MSVLQTEAERYRIASDWHGVISMPKNPEDAFYSEESIRDDHYENLLKPVDELDPWDFAWPLNASGERITDWRILLPTSSRSPQSFEGIKYYVESTNKWTKIQALLNISHGVHKGELFDKFEVDHRIVRSMKKLMTLGCDVLLINSLPNCCAPDYLKLLKTQHLWPINANGDVEQFSLNKQIPAIIRRTNIPPTPYFKGIGVKLGLNLAQANDQEFFYLEDDYYIARILAGALHANVMMPMSRDEAHNQLKGKNLKFPSGTSEDDEQWITFGQGFPELVEMIQDKIKSDY